MRLMFLCSGNICRSPMAAEYCRQAAGETGLADLIVDSAGTLRIEGAPASPEAIQVMAELGVDLTRHRSKGLRAQDLRRTDLVLAMHHDHLDYLARRHPEGKDRRLLLRAFENSPRPDPYPRDLEDPIGQSVAFYREQAELIRRCVDHLVLHLRQS